MTKSGTASSTGLCAPGPAKPLPQRIGPWLHEPLANQIEIALRKLVTDWQHLKADIGTRVPQDRGEFGGVGLRDDRIDFARDHQHGEA